MLLPTDKSGPHRESPRRDCRRLDNSMIQTANHLGVARPLLRPAAQQRDAQGVQVFGNASHPLAFGEGRGVRGKGRETAIRFSPSLVPHPSPLTLIDRLVQRGDAEGQLPQDRAESDNLRWRQASGHGAGAGGLIVCLAGFSNPANFGPGP